MKTIEEAAQQFADKEAFLNEFFTQESDQIKAERACYKAALSMAEFVQRWIPVEEELPDRYDKNTSFTNNVLITDRVGGIFIGYYDYSDNSWISYSDEIEIDFIIAWRPIQIE